MGVGGGEGQGWRPAAGAMGLPRTPAAIDRNGLNHAAKGVIFRVPIGTWRSPVAHLNGVQGVAGSNPAVPTHLFAPQAFRLAGLLFLRIRRPPPRGERIGTRRLEPSRAGGAQVLPSNTASRDQDPARLTTSSNVRARCAFGPPKLRSEIRSKNLRKLAVAGHAVPGGDCSGFRPAVRGVSQVAGFHGPAYRLLPSRALVRSSAARAPRASSPASPILQKWTKRSRGSSSSM